MVTFCTAIDGRLESTTVWLNALIQHKADRGADTTDGNVSSLLQENLRIRETGDTKVQAVLCWLFDRVAIVAIPKLCRVSLIPDCNTALKKT